MSVRRLTRGEEGEVEVVPPEGSATVGGRGISRLEGRREEEGRREGKEAVLLLFPLSWPSP
jgi:hypothetical protein